MIDSNKAFRDYATRVSFNMSLSRNQIFVLRSVMLDIQMQAKTFNERTDATRALRDEIRGVGAPDYYVSGIRHLLSIGILENDPRWTADEKQCDEARANGLRAIKKYWGPSCRLTEAGLHVVALLRLAGLIEPAAANDKTFTIRKGKSRG